jgi:hypothetical protein
VVKLDDQCVVVRGKADQAGLQRQPVLDIERLTQPFLCVVADGRHSLGRAATFDRHALEPQRRRSHSLSRLAVLEEKMRSQHLVPLADRRDARCQRIHIERPAQPGDLDHMVGRRLELAQHMNALLLERKEVAPGIGGLGAETRGLRIAASIR